MRSVPLLPRPQVPPDHSRSDPHRSRPRRTGSHLGSAFTPHADAAAQHGPTLDWRIRLALEPFGQCAEIRCQREKNCIHVSAQCAPRLAAELEERWRAVVEQFADLRVPVPCTSRDHTTHAPPTRWFIGTRLGIARQRRTEAQALARHWAEIHQERETEVHHLVEDPEASDVVCEAH